MFVILLSNFHKVGNGIKPLNSTTPPLWGVFMYVTPFAYQKNILVVLVFLDFSNRVLRFQTVKGKRTLDVLDIVA